MKKALLVLSIILLLFLPVNAQRTLSFSSELSEGLQITWQVNTFVQRGETVEESNDTYFIHEGSEIEVNFVGNPAEIDLNQSTDISAYFEMTYDKSRSRNL